MPEESSTGSTVPLNLLLDIDGTLAITDRLYLLAFQDLMRPFGYTEVDEAWFEKHVAGKVDVEVFRALLPADSTTEMLEATSRKKDALFVQKAASEGAAIVPGLREVLQMARSRVENGHPEANSPSSIGTLRPRQSESASASSLAQPRPMGTHALGRGRTGVVFRIGAEVWPTLTLTLTLTPKLGAEVWLAVHRRDERAARRRAGGARHATAGAGRRRRRRDRGSGGGLRVRASQAASRPVPGGDTAAGRRAGALHRLRG